LKILGEKGSRSDQTHLEKHPPDKRKKIKTKTSVKFIRGNTKTYEKLIRMLAKIAVIKNKQRNMEKIERYSREEIEDPE